MADDQDVVLWRLLDAAGSPAEPVRVTRLTGRGFSDEVSRVVLSDGRQVVLRRWEQARPVESPRAAFLVAQGVPAPGLLAAEERASLVEFVPGRLLGDLIEDGHDDAVAWAAVGTAYRRVHDVAFPAVLAGQVAPDRLILRPCDPVEVAHGTLTAAVAGLTERCPDVAEHVPSIRRRIDRCAGWLRAAPTSLRHGDVNMWNVLVDRDRAVLIDWDAAEVGDPAMEIALLDKHASLFNGRGLPAAFFAGYGPRLEPRTTLHRIVETAGWVGSDDWRSFATEGDLPAELRRRAAGWLSALIEYLRELHGHLERLDRLIDETPPAGAADPRGA